jgi:RIO-like serine/threonine protein kinase
MIAEENFKFGRTVGSGKEGVIYRALDLKTGAIVAIKKFPVPQLDKAKRQKMEVDR